MLNPDPGREKIGYLVRHGELNISNKWDGWGSFVLSAEGRESAEKAGQWLAFERVGRIVTSDLPRALQTADIIMQEINPACPFLGTEPNIRAWAIGEFTGKEKTPERKEKFTFYREHPDEMIPGGESFNQFCERVKVAFQYLCTPYQGLPTVLVMHNSVIKALFGLDEKGDVIDPGGIIAVYLNEKGECEFEVMMGATKLDDKIGLDASCG